MTFRNQMNVQDGKGSINPRNAHLVFTNVQRTQTKDLLNPVIKMLFQIVRNLSN